MQTFVKSQHQPQTEQGMTTHDSTQLHVSGWATYRRLLRYTRQYARVLIFAIIGMVAAGLTEVAFAALMKPLLDG
ncbi:MAG: hypothetical protein RBR56_01780, partial [Halothiobacillus sp.]|nr:hypothetical protein [Halothiobacillus sp.]